MSRRKQPNPNKVRRKSSFFLSASSPRTPTRFPRLFSSVPVGNFGPVASAGVNFTVGEDEDSVLPSASLPSLMRIQAVEFSLGSSSFGRLKLIIVLLWCVCERVFFIYFIFSRVCTTLNGLFAWRRRSQPSPTTTPDAGGRGFKVLPVVEHPYLGCTLVGASLLVAMCKVTRHQRPS